MIPIAVHLTITVPRRQQLVVEVVAKVAEHKEEEAAKRASIRMARELQTVPTQKEPMPLPLPLKLQQQQLAWRQTLHLSLK